MPDFCVPALRVKVSPLSRMIFQKSNEAILYNGAHGGKPMAKVQLKVERVTGRVRYYPVGENAQHVLQLTKKKTLSELDVEALKALGCEIERLPEAKR